MQRACAQVFFLYYAAASVADHHLALDNRKGRGERISSLQRAVRDIMGDDWNVRMRSGVTNVVDVYTDVPRDHQLDLESNAMAVLWESRKEGQSVRRLQYSRSTSTWYCPWAKIVSVRKTLGVTHPHPTPLISCCTLPAATI